MSDPGGEQQHPSSPDDRSSKAAVAKIVLTDSDLSTLTAKEFAERWKSQDLFIASVEHRLAQHEGRYFFTWRFRCWLLSHKNRASVLRKKITVLVPRVENIRSDVNSGLSSLQARPWNSGRRQRGCAPSWRSCSIVRRCWCGDWQPRSTRHRTWRLVVHFWPPYYYSGGGCSVVEKMLKSHVVVVSGEKFSVARGCGQWPQLEH